MDDKFNTIAGWALFSGIVGLGLTSLSSHYFRADKPHRPHDLGYVIEGVVEEGGAQETPLPVLLAAAEVSKGEAIFAKCASCHTIAPGGANGIGPNLHGIMGETIGAGHPGFAFSDALKSVGGTWTFEAMDAWLKSPKAFAPGTKMTFAGLGKPEDRAAMLVYLNAQGSNLPLPAVPEDALEGNFGEAGTGDTAGVGADPGDSAGPAGAATLDTPAAAGAMAQPAPKVQGGGDGAVGTVSETQAN